MQNKVSKATSVSIAFIMIMVQLFTLCRFNDIKHVISWDGYGNYLYLPAVFIYHDLGLKDTTWQNKLHAEYLTDEPQYQFAPGINGKQVDVCTTGVALAYLPFFVAGHTYAKISSYKADGMSLPYQYAMMIAALFYALSGIFILRSVLLKFFSDKLTSILLLFIFLGTNFFIFSSAFAFGSPHALLLMLNCAILNYTIKWYDKEKIKYAIYIGLLVGLSAIIRPTTIVIALIPLLWGLYSRDSIKKRILFLKKNGKQVACLLGCLISVGLIQVLYWVYTTGALISNNHVEGFEFLRPFLLKVLFRYKKGWLLYTPLMALSMLGFYSLYKKNKPIFTSVLAYFIINSWIVSSWECWWYAASFGQRVMIDSYGILVLPLGYFYSSLLNKKAYRIMLGVGAFLVLLNLFQSYQYLFGIIDNERMTSTYYWSAFMDIKKDTLKNKYLEINHYTTKFSNVTASTYSEKEIYHDDFQNKANLLDGGILVDSIGEQRLLVTEHDEYTINFKKAFNQITDKDHLFIKLSFLLYPLDSTNTHSTIVFTMQNYYGRNYGYIKYELDKSQMHYRKWNRVECTFITPEILHRSDILNLYYWNVQHKNAFLRDIKIMAYEPKLTE